MTTPGNQPAWRRVLLLAALAAGLGARAFAASQYILETAAGQNGVQVAAGYGLTIVRQLTETRRSVYVVSSPAPVSPPVAQAIRSDPAVLEFEDDTHVSSPEVPPAARIVPSAPSLTDLTNLIFNRTPVPFFGATVRAGYPQQYASSLIRLPNTQSSIATGGGIVAVIDTGVDPSHPALSGVLVPGYDFTRNQPGFANELADLSQSTVAILDQSTVAILDHKWIPVMLNQSTVAILDQSTVAILDGGHLPGAFGHGTMVAGLVHLVAPTARIMPLKAFRADGSADLADIVRAVYYAVDHGATVINMSFSSPTASPELATALAYAAAHQVVCIASAGNEGQKVKTYPAAASYVIGVGSTTPQDKRSAFSNYGTDSVRLAAPGEGLVTTYPGNNYAAVWGTSFSAALVSGAAALMDQFPSLANSGKVGEAIKHGREISVDGLGECRLDTYSSLRYFTGATASSHD